MQSAHMQLHLTRPVLELRSVQQPAQRWRAFCAAPAPGRGVRPRTFLPAAKQAADNEKEEKKEQKGEKGEGEGPWPYPDRTAWTGGWAGGEKGVKAFVAEFENEPTESQKREIAQQVETEPDIVKVSFQGKKVEARRIGEGEPIYIGAKKGSKDASSPQYLVDDARKYPGRESVGPLSSVVGGFAGGERGVQQFVQEGEVRLADKGRKQSSPLVFAGIVAALGTAGGLFLTNVEEVGEEVVESLEKADFSGAAASASASRSALLSGFDPRTKLALEVALAAIGVSALLFYGKKTAGDLANSLRDGIISLGKLAIFWTLVVIAAKYVIEN